MRRREHAPLLAAGSADATLTTGKMAIHSDILVKNDLKKCISI